MARKETFPCATEHVPTPSHGGPQTDAGKARSRHNSLTHGLTATKLLPAVLGAETLDRYVQQFCVEWQPTSPTQKIVVAEMARHAAALEFLERAEPAVLRCGASAGSQLQACNGEDSFADTCDRVLASAVTTDAADRLTRYRRAHEKGFYQALKHLQELSRRGIGVAQLSRIEPPFPFNEDECRGFLLRRFHVSEFQCPRCGHARGYPLAQRSRFQCAGCNAQIGIRNGTVMEGSPLPLVVWFRAIWHVLQEPDTSLTTLAEVTKISRTGTLRRMVGKIRAAIDSGQTSLLLAGLDGVLEAQRSRHTRLPETAVP